LTAVKVLFASANDATIAQTLNAFKAIHPELPLVVVSEFAPTSARTGPAGPAEGSVVGSISTDVEWIPYHIRRKWSENRALLQSRLQGREIRLAAMILEPRTPHWPMRFLAIATAGFRLLAFSETGQHFRMRPDNLHVMVAHLFWRAKNQVRVWLRFAKTLRDPCERQLLRLYLAARFPAHAFRPAPQPFPWAPRALAPGISVVIPSRNGRELLATCLPRISGADEIIVVDNGSDDGTAEYLASAHPWVEIESSSTPLSFTDAVNRGIERARFSHVCLLNNDMLAEPGFLTALRNAFNQVPDLFSASAQIFFPEGQRREETGKTVWRADLALTALPIWCDQPLEGEDQSYVLYGSGGCTLYDAAKLAQLGSFDPRYQPAYVEDLDLGVRAWQRGWPSVYCAGAKVLHQHRATTSRYFTPAELDQILERNFVRFLARFGHLWRENLRRLRDAGKVDALREAAENVTVSRPAAAPFLALVSGDVAVFPGRAASARPRVLMASPYLPFPLSHGAAVRIYNLMRRAAADFDLILISFVDDLAPVPPELLAIAVEVIEVRRPGTHALPSTGRPDTVEEFDSPAFHAALRQTVAKWTPAIAQLEFTQMAQYAPDCSPARTILVEHDITYDLYAQMLQQQEDWENRRQYNLWQSFETAAWGKVDRVVVMSEKDRAVVMGSVTIANGVDLERFQPSGVSPEPRRLLFIGSFAHRPNVLALEFFLRDVFPLLHGVTLHVVAGQRHERFWDLHHEGVEVEGFVSDVRPAYDRATVVIAPLVASAGTNIKILEAMAMGKAIVSTEAGVHGLDLERGADVVIANAAAETAEAIARLLDSPQERAALERHARRTAEQRYGWDAIAEQQARLYREILQ
jgi:GT2 family glycosyltransferase/glycosyltransferase involved in cell wall biosynthesis